MRTYTLDYQKANGTSLLTSTISISPQVNGAAPGLAPVALIQDNEPTNLDQIDSGFIIHTSDNSIGYAVAMGDINNNGKADMVLGDPGYNQNNGGIYVLYDGTTNYDLLSATSVPSQGIWFTGIGATGSSIAMTNTYRYIYSTHSQLVDLDGDSLADIVIGAPQADNGNSALTGKVYILYGKDILNLSKGSSYDLEQDPNNIVKKITVGFNGTVDNTKTYPENYAEFGYALALGDINGDNYADIAIGAPQYNEGAGGVYLLYGSNSGVTNTTPQLVFEGSTSSNSSSTVGYSVAIASSFALETVNGKTGAKTYSSKKSFDGDIYGDLIIGAPNYSQEINNSWDSVAGFTQTNSNVPEPSDTSNTTLGRAYVLWGKNLNSSSATVTESNFNSNNGLIIDALELTNGSSSLIKGTLNDMVVGDNVASAGDLDNDGNVDIAISVPEINNSKGAVFLLKGLWFTARIFFLRRDYFQF